MSIESGEPTTRRGRHRSFLLALVISFALLAAIAVLALALAFTVFRVSTPTSEFLSSQVSRVSFTLPPALPRPNPPLLGFQKQPNLPLPGSPSPPSFRQHPGMPNFPFPRFPTIPIFRLPWFTPPATPPPNPPFRLKFTLELVVRVNNSNRFAFSHSDPGTTQLLYRGVRIGDAMVKPGRTPARGSEVVNMSLEVDADRMSPELGHAFLDFLGGEMAFDTETRLPGELSLFGILKRNAVATSRCRVVVGFPEGKVLRSKCTVETKL